MRRPFLAIALGLPALALAPTLTPLVAQTRPAAAKVALPSAAKMVTAGTYAVDPNHTMVGWRLNHFNVTDYFGIFGSVTGTLTIDPANLAATKVDVIIPVSKVTTASAGLTDHLLKPAEPGKKPDFFGANPADAKFVSTAVVTNKAQNRARIAGNLTLNGVTKPVVLDAKFNGAAINPLDKKLNIGFHATGKIKRSDFGIDMAIPMVGDTVALDIVAAFEK